MPIPVVNEYLTAFDAANNDVVQGAGRVNTELSGHDWNLIDCSSLWYILIDIYQYKREVRMDTAKIFSNGRSQAVRIPKAFRFEGDEVYIKKTPDGVLLIPKTKSGWDLWEKNLLENRAPFMTERNQPVVQQHREGLDEISD